jgi:hypothetical protein
MLEFLAIPVVVTLVVLVAAVMLRRHRARFVDHPTVYRAGFSALVASFAPTLLMGGHGALPLPTVTGVVIALSRMKSATDLHLTWIGFGSEQAGVLVMPFVLCFVVLWLTPWSRVGNGLRNQA